MSNVTRPAPRLSVAPMMDWTDRHCRYLHRQLSRETLLYTEMVTSAALVRGGAGHLLEYSRDEHPVALQLGGSEPEELAEAARMGAAAGYDEINLNVGCPSDRVQSGRFGAVLMGEPALVAECVRAMAEAVEVEVTVKCRIGIDDQVPEETLPAFLESLRGAGVRRVIVHARKAWLQGLSPKENRDVPPLDYELVTELKRARPDLTIVLNGGLDMDAAMTELPRFDGVMLGRVAYQSPAVLLGVDSLAFGSGGPVRSAEDAAMDFRETLSRRLLEGVPLHAMTRHMLGLFNGRPGARLWRRTLSEKAPGARGSSAIAIFDEALSAVAGYRRVGADA